MPAIRSLPTHVLRPCADDGWRIPDVLWEHLVPLLPARTPHPLGGHRPRGDDRKAMEAIFFGLRPGCPWHALHATGSCSSRAAHRRCLDWGEADVFVAWWEQGLGDYDAWQGIDWAWLAMDGAMTQAPLGGETGGQASARPRQKRPQTPQPHRRPGRAHRAGGGRREAP